MNEIWKSIDGYEGLYEVSNLGRVRSLNYNRTGKIQVLKPRKDKKKTKSGCYERYIIGLCNDGKPKNHKLHVLVGKAFVPGWFKGAVINHKDHDPSNNIYTNLEWTTQKDNCSSEKSFAPDSELRKSNARTACKEKLSKPVVQFDLNFNFVKEWKSLHEAAKEGFSYKAISPCCAGKRYMYKNFRWFYKDDLVYFF